MGDILYMLLVVLVVAAVLYGSYRFSRYLSKQSVKMGGSASYMRVVDRLPVGPDRFMLIVEIQQKYYLVSTTGQSIEVLRELDDFIERQAPEEERTGFAQSFKTVLQDYVRKK